LIIGLNRSAIGTLVERKTRFSILLHLPRMEGYGLTAPTKNGPALAGRGAATVRDAIVDQFGDLPELLRRSLTWDQGAEMAQHAQLRVEAGLEVYFCDPHSPWQRGTNENTVSLTAYCGSISRRAPTCRGIRPGTSRPSRVPSTPPPQSPQLENSSRGHQRPASLGHTNWCCFDCLNLSNTPQSGSPTTLDVEQIAPLGRLGRRRLQRVDGVDHRPLQGRMHQHRHLSRRGPTKAWQTSSTPLPDGSSGTTTVGSTSSLGYLSPVEFEQAHYAALKPEVQPV
jgi:hypothetical protein